jgi:4-amino-4-deoxy-L-arabinose transferase-like glycosyltransferase
LNGTLDLLEWLAWGHQWQLGYHKHPPLAAWLAAAFHYLTPGSLIGVYFLSNLIIAFTLWCVWRVAREIVVPRLALLSALCLEGYLYFTLESPEYSNNIVLCATWMATVLSLQQALKTNAPRWWFALGLSIGLSALTKYSIGFLVIPLIAFTIIEPRTCIIWRSKEVYLAAAIALLVFVPHLVWMRATDFMTIEYALDRAAGYQHWYDRLLFPLAFLLDQSARIIPVLQIIAPVLWHGRGQISTSYAHYRRFLAFAFVGPIVLLLAASAVFGL